MVVLSDNCKSKFIVTTPPPKKKSKYEKFQSVGKLYNGLCFHTDFHHLQQIL